MVQTQCRAANQNCVFISALEPTVRVTVQEQSTDSNSPFLQYFFITAPSIWSVGSDYLRYQLGTAAGFFLPKKTPETD